MDYYGNLCGVTNYVLPNGEDTINLPKAYPMPSGFAVCVDSCPDKTDYDTFICEYDIQHQIDAMVSSDVVGGIVSSDEAEAKKSLYLFYASRKQCMPQIESMSFLGYCIPKVKLFPLRVPSGHTKYSP